MKKVFINKCYAWAYTIKKELYAVKPAVNQPQYVPRLHYIKTKTYEVNLHINSYNIGFFY